jgi:exopolysaccharide production protein ExoZ
LIPKGPWIGDVYWTLAVEIGFYSLIFLLLCAGLFSAISRVALALTICSSISLIILATRLGPIEIVERGNVALARHGAFFALGIWIWISTTRRLLGWEIAASVLAISACISEIYLRGLEFLPAQGWLTSPVIVWLIGLAAIYWFSRNDAPKYFRSFGLMTYPLYLVHHVVGLARASSQVSTNGLHSSLVFCG